MIIIDKFDCSHWATDDDPEGILVALKRQAADEDGWKNVIHYATYCSACHAKAYVNNELLLNDEEEMNWLNRGVD